ncbi:MAG TPA: VWA domain-containing protein [Acidobacteriota bacterium]|nr:VWA domain-containing protein [Acidobacteriota bacterium]
MNRQKKISSLSLCLLASLLISAQPPEGESDPIFQAEGLSVIVDVVVTDRRNRVVTDLKPEDFVVYEDGVVQEIDSVVFFHSSEQAGDAALASSDQPEPFVSEDEGVRATAHSPILGPRHNLLIFLLDYSTTAYENQHLVQEAAIKYVRENLHPTDYAAVFVLGSGLRMLQDFTNDGDQLVEVLQLRDFSGRSLASLADAPTGPGNAGLVADGLVGAPAAGGSAEAGQAAAEAGSALASAAVGLRIERMFYNMQSFVQEREARGVLQSIQAISQVTAPIEGRKTLFLFSQGFVIGPHVELELEKTINMANRANLAIYGVDSQGLAAGTLSGALVPDGELGSISARREGSPLFGRRIDATGGESLFDRAKQVGSDVRDSALRHVSTATGGFAIRHTNDLHVGLQRVDEDIRSYFLISYRPKNQALDGTFRSIRVEILRSGYEVRHRSGYAALPSGMELLSAEDFQALAAAQSGQFPLTLPAYLRAEQFAGQGLERDVLISLEIPTRGIEFRTVRQNGETLEQAEIEVIAVMRDEAGRVLMRFGTPMDLSFTSQELEALKEGGLSFNNKTELLPGIYSFQVLVRDRNSSNAALIERPLRIQPPTEGLSISSVVLGKSVEQGQFGGAEMLTVAGNTVVPSAGRQFSNGENLVYYFEVYPGSSSENLAVDLSVRRSGAQEAFELPEQTISPQPDGAKIPVSRYIELAGLPAGTYFLTAKVRDQRTGEVAQTQTPFQIVQ